MSRYLVAVVILLVAGCTQKRPESLCYRATLVPIDEGKPLVVWVESLGPVLDVSYDRGTLMVERLSIQECDSRRAWP